tara:strand:+ start:390 stop:1067 length:678 start_codon:yes stop_codon:yes gene_type:complete
MHQSIDKKNKVIIYLVFLFILSTTSGKYLEKQTGHLFKIDNIKVLGLTNSKNLEIQSEMKSFFYKNILFIEKEKIHKIINKHNIVEEYNIMKIYPSTLNIEVKPAKFLAKISNYNNLIVGSNGKLISDEHSDKNLPYLFGEFNSKKFLEFKKNIEKSKFKFFEFKNIYFFPSNRWDILTNDDVLIKLPKVKVSEYLNKAYNVKASNKFKDIKIIDLRIKDHLIIK